METVKKQTVVCIPEEIPSVLRIGGLIAARGTAF